MFLPYTVRNTLSSAKRLVVGQRGLRYTYTCTHTLARARTHGHAHTQACAYTHTRKPQRCFFRFQSEICSPVPDGWHLARLGSGARTRTRERAHQRTHARVPVAQAHARRTKENLKACVELVPIVQYYRLRCVAKCVRCD